SGPADSIRRRAVDARRTRRHEHGVPRTSLALRRQRRGVAARLVVRRRHDRVRRGPARACQLRRCRVPRALRDDYELIYLRPHLSRRRDALQYTPIYNGSEAWQLYSGPGYTAQAELPLNRWLHVKLVVSGYAARLFVDGAPNPQLTVTSLRRPWARG